MLFEGVASSFNAANVRCKPPIWLGGVTGLNGSDDSIVAGKELEAMIKNDLLKDTDFKEQKIMLVGGRLGQGDFFQRSPLLLQISRTRSQIGTTFHDVTSDPPPPPPASSSLATLTRALTHVVLHRMDIA